MLATGKDRNLVNPMGDGEATADFVGGRLAALLAVGESFGRTRVPYGHAEVYKDRFGGEPVFRSYLGTTSGNILLAVARNFMTNGFVALFPESCWSALEGSTSISITARISILPCGRQSRCLMST